MDYTKVIKKIFTQLKKKNIDIYYKKFLIKLEKFEIKTSFNDDIEFVLYMLKFVRMYHHHAFFYIPTHENYQNNFGNKPTKFTLGKDNIGIIKFYSFIINYGISKELQKKEKKNMKMI
jgi:hypothetical protein